MQSCDTSISIISAWSYSRFIPVKMEFLFDTCLMLWRVCQFHLDPAQLFHHPKCPVTSINTRLVEWSHKSNVSFQSRLEYCKSSLHAFDFLGSVVLQQAPQRPEETVKACVNVCTWEQIWGKDRKARNELIILQRISKTYSPRTGSNSFRSPRDGLTRSSFLNRARGKGR